MHIAIAPVNPIETPVAVTHIVKDTLTGRSSPLPVSNAATVDTGAVAFAADGFSAYLLLDERAIG